MITNDTWLISDTHFGHRNIINFCNRPPNHEDVMFRNWANTVGPDDTILHLGDVAFGNRKAIYDWAQQIEELPGNKYLIKGNHDHSSSMKVYKGIFEVVYPFIENIGGKRFYFSHYPDHPTTEYWDVNIHGHIHNNPLLGDFTQIRNLDREYVNVSVEVINYTPVKFSSILEKLNIPF